MFKNISDDVKGKIEEWVDRDSGIEMHEDGLEINLENGKSVNVFYHMLESGGQGGTEYPIWHPNWEPFEDFIKKLYDEIYENDEHFSKFRDKAEEYAIECVYKHIKHEDIITTPAMKVVEAVTFDDVTEKEWYEATCKTARKLENIGTVAWQYEKK